MASEKSAARRLPAPGELSEAGKRALAAVDQVLNDRPNKIGHDFSEAVIGVSQLREQVIRERRADPSSHALLQRLGRLNSVLSVLVGAHYPLGDIPWDCLEESRGILAEIVAEEIET